MSVYKKNNKYYCRFQIDGERHHYLCNGASSVKEAEKIEAAFKFKLQQQQNGVIQREEEKVTLNLLYSNYEEYAQLNKKTWQRDLQRLAKVKEIWKKKKFAEDIKPLDIEKLKNELLKRGLSTTTVNRYLEILSKMFNLAIDNEWLIKNPIKKHTKFKEKNYQIRYLKEDEEERLFKNASPTFYGIMLVALNTGLREGNIINLKGKNINLDFRIIELTENKGNKHIKLPMNNVLYNYFKNSDLQSDDYVFKNLRTNEAYKISAFQREWVALKTRANVKNLRFHDLRHTVGTRLAQRGVPIPVIKEIMAHSDISTTMRYVHQASEQLLQAVNLL